MKTREIDFSEIDFKNTGSIVNEDYFVTYSDHQIALFLTDNAENYALKFGKVEHDDASIKIYGTNNNIVIHGSNLHVNTIQASVKRLTIEEDCKIKSELINVMSDKFDNYGYLHLRDIAVDCISEKMGFINHGEINIDGMYEQNQGAFVNENRFKSSKFLIQNGGLVWNREQAEMLITDKQQITAEAYLADGNVMARHSAVKSESIVLKNVFHGESSLLIARDLLHVLKDSDIKIDELNAVSQNDLIVEGKLTDFDKIQAWGKNTTITSSAKFVDCKKLVVMAEEYLKCQEKSEFNDVEDIIFGANYLLVDTSVISKQHLVMHGGEYIYLHSEKELQSKEIQLLGKNCFLHGNINGEVSTPAPFNHFYLSDSSTITDSRLFQVQANDIEIYGRVSADINEIIAYRNILTGVKTELNGKTHYLRAANTHHAGQIISNSIDSEADLQLSLDPALRLKSKKTHVQAPMMGLNGKIESSITAIADSLLNQAQISHAEMTDFFSNTEIVNASNSSIDSKNIFMDSETVLDQGKFAAGESIQERAGRFYQTKRATKTSQTDHVTAYRAVIAGESTAAKKCSLRVKKSVKYIDSSQLSGDAVSIVSDGKIFGSLNTDVNKAEVIAQHLTELVDGTLYAKERLDISSHEVTLDTSIVTKDLSLKQINTPKTNGDSHLHISEKSTITATKLEENFDEAKIKGKMKLGEGHLRSAKNITVTKNADLEFGKILSANTPKFEFDGKVTSTYQEPKADKEDEKEYKEPVGFQIVAKDVEFGENTHTNTSTPINVNAEAATYSGKFDSTIITNAKSNVFDNGCHVVNGDNKVIVIGKTPDSTVTIKPAAFIEGCEALFQSIKELKVSGTLGSKLIAGKIDNVQVDALGRLGSEKSTVHLETDNFYLDGTLEAEKGFIKCRRMFMQNGFRGEARIVARSINITSPIYLDFFGVTEAQQASLTSFLAACLGFKFVNYSVNNSVINIAPIEFTVLHIRNLTQVIDDIAEGKINLLDPAYLTYSIQTLLAILQTAMPGLLTNVAGMGLNAYSIVANINELKKMSKKAEEDKKEAEKNKRSVKEPDLVDYLPYFVAIKNISIASVMLSKNVLDTFPDLEDYVFDKMTDFANYMGSDFLITVRDFFHFHSHKKDGQKPGEKPKHHHKKPPKVKPAKEPKKLDPTIIESLKDWFEHFNLHDYLTDTVIGRYTMPVASVLAPSSFSDSIINFNLLSPKLTGFSTQRSLFDFSWGSPVFGLSSNKIGAAIFDYSNDYAFSQSRTGLYVQMSDSTHANLFNLTANKYSQTPGSKVRATHAVVSQEHLQGHDIKGSKSLTLKYSSVDGSELKLFKLDGQFACYRPDDPANATVNYVTYHPLVFDPSMFGKKVELPWGVTYKGTGVEVKKAMKIESHGKIIGLVASEGDVIIAGKLKSAETIYEEARNKIIHNHATTRSLKLFMFARNDIDLMHSSDKTKEGCLISKRGNVLAKDHDLLKAKGFLYIESHEHITAKDHSRVEGGDGYGHGGTGLVGMAGNKVVNHGSKIGAIGNYHLSGYHGIEGYVPYHKHSHKHHVHLSWTGLLNNRYRSTESIQREKFYSRTGSGHLSAQHGTIHLRTAYLDVAESTYLYSRDQPIFDGTMQHSAKSQSKTLLGIPLHKHLHSEDRMVGQRIHSPELIDVECLYGDINIGDTKLKTKMLHTNAWDGSVYIYQTPVRQHDIDWSLTVGGNISSVNVSHSFNPSDKHPNKIWVQDPLLDGIKSFKHVHDPADGVAKSVNTTDAAVATALAIQSGQYVKIFNSTVGINAGYTRTETWSERSGDGYVQVGYWLDDSQRINLNVPANIGTLQMRCGNHFYVHGNDYDYNSKSDTVTLGLAYDFATNSLIGSGSYGGSISHGRYASRCDVRIDDAIFGNDIMMDIDNGSVRINRLYGNVTNANVTSHADINKQTAFSLSGSTAGNVSGSYSQTQDNYVNKVSYLYVGDMTHGHVGHANLVGGELRGNGFKTSKPDSITDTPIVSKHHELGLSISVNLRERNVNSVSYTNTRDVTPTGGDTRHHGFKFELNNPVNIFNLFAQPNTRPEANNEHDDFQTSTLSAESEESHDEIQTATVSAESEESKALYLVNDDEEHIETLLNNTNLLPGYAVYDTHGRYYGFVPLNSLDKTRTDHPHNEEHHNHPHLHFPTPKEAGHIWSLPLNVQVKIYRGDDRPPELVFKRGFVAKGSNDNLHSHVVGEKGGAPHNSRFVSTSLSKEIASRFPIYLHENQPSITYVYTINWHKDAVNVDSEFAKQGITSTYEELEMAVLDKIKPRDIQGVNIQYHWPERQYLSKNFVENPGYRRLWTFSEFGAHATSVVSHGLTALAIGHDTYGLYNSAVSNDSLLREAASVSSKWTMAAMATAKWIPYATKTLKCLVKVAPIVASVTPVGRLGAMIFTSTVGSILGEHAAANAPEISKNVREGIRHENFL